MDKAKKKVDPREVMKTLGDALTSQPIYQDITIKKFSFLERVKIRLGLRVERERALLFPPLCMGPMIRISKMLLSIPGVKMNEDGMTVDRKALFPDFLMIMSQHGETVMEIIVLAMQNDDRNVADPADVKFVRDNYTSTDMRDAMNIIIQQLDVSDFMSSIISIKGGVRLLEEEMSLTTIEGIIASINGSEAISPIST